MIALDTNILVRFLVDDDPAQADIANELMNHPGGVFISKTTLLFCKTYLTIKSCANFIAFIKVNINTVVHTFISPTVVRSNHTFKGRNIIT